MFVESTFLEKQLPKIADFKKSESQSVSEFKFCFFTLSRYGIQKRREISLNAVMKRKNIILTTIFNIFYLFQNFSLTILPTF